MIPLIELKYLLRESVSANTSLIPTLWTKEKWTYGHCAVFCLIVKDYFGGKIQRGLLPQEWKEKLGYRSHYWNVLDNGTVIDLSREQFPPDFPYEEFIAGFVGDSSDAEDKREYILQSRDTEKRYLLLKERVNKLLYSNPIFLDEKFQRCWELAFSAEAKCPKMRFACLVYDNHGHLIAEDVNRLMTLQFGTERFCSLDGSRCIRLEITSRMDPVIGDCGHAPIWCLRKVFDKGYSPANLHLLDFYEAGFYSDGTPWWRKELTYSCLLCETVFAIFGLDKIWGVFEGKWQKLITKDSFYKAAKYALGEKRV